MKLLELTSDFVDCHGLIDLAMATDSAIITRGRPVFLPDIASEWSVQIAPAFRISRLGKSIAARFAGRYIDAFTLAARLVPVYNTENDEPQVPLNSPALTAFDGAYALGQWISIPDDYDRDSSIVFETLSPASLMWFFSLDSADRAIELISRTFTLKSGDVIIPNETYISFAVAINDHVEARIGDRTVLSYNIK